MAFAARQRGAQAVQGEVSQSYVEQETDAVVDFGEQAFAHFRLVGGECQRVEEFLQFGDGQVYQIRNGPSAHFHISGFGAQARAVALGTDRFAPVACQHDAVLYLVLVFLQHLEEVVDADFLFGR